MRRGVLRRAAIWCGGMALGAALLLSATEGRALQISFEQSGGFAGLRRQVMVDTDQLPPEEAQRVCDMVRDADFFHLPAKIASQRPQPDRFQYQLWVTQGKERHGVTVSEEAVPQQLEPLVKWLQEAVRRQKPAAR